MSNVYKHNRWLPHAVKSPCSIDGALAIDYRSVYHICIACVIVQSIRSIITIYCSLSDIKRPSITPLHVATIIFMAPNVNNRLKVLCLTVVSYVCIVAVTVETQCTIVRPNAPAAVAEEDGAAAAITITIGTITRIGMTIGILLVEEAIMIMERSVDMCDLFYLFVLCC